MTDHTRTLNDAFTRLGRGDITAARRTATTVTATVTTADGHIVDIDVPDHGPVRAVLVMRTDGADLIDVTALPHEEWAARDAVDLLVR